MSSKVKPSQGGQFNYALKKTGFLGEAKMRAKRIAQNPKLFLESYAEKNLEVVPLEIPELDQFIDGLKNTSRFDSKESDMVERQELAKKRAFLLGLAASTPTASQVDDFLDDEDGKRDAEKIDHMIESFLAQIRGADLTGIQSWLSQSVSNTPNGENRPYGLPNQLRLPLESNANEGTIDKILDSAFLNFVESTTDDFLLMDGEYHTKLEEITKRLQANIGNILNHCWTLEDTALLSYVATVVGESNNKPHSKRLLHELTSKLFRDKSTEQIIAQKYLLRTKKCLEDKKSSVIRDWIRDKEDLQVKVNLAWQEMNKKRFEKLEKTLNRNRQENICRQWTQKLEKQRKEKCERIRGLEISLESVRRSRFERERLQRDKEETRRASIKFEVKKFEEKKVEAKINKIKDQEIVSNMLREMEKIQARKNRTRVEFRVEQQQTKIKTRHEKRIALEEERQQRLAILEATKEPVQIEYDPINLIADTHVTALRRFETVVNINSEEEKMVKFFRERYSFSAETILRDRRNRVEAKLREVGLLDSSYARQVLLAMEPKPKPHLDSQIKFSY